MFIKSNLKQDLNAKIELRSKIHKFPAFNHCLKLAVSMYNLQISLLYYYQARLYAVYN